jgi:hypothetical protein
VTLFIFFTTAAGTEFISAKFVHFEGFLVNYVVGVVVCYGEGKENLSLKIAFDERGGNGLYFSSYGNGNVFGESNFTAQSEYPENLARESISE